MFIRISFLDAYLILGFLGWALIGGGRLFKAGRLLNNEHYSNFIPSVYHFLGREGGAYSGLGTYTKTVFTLSRGEVYLIKEMETFV